MQYAGEQPPANQGKIEINNQPELTGGDGNHIGGGNNNQLGVALSAAQLFFEKCSEQG